MSSRRRPRRNNGNYSNPHLIGTTVNVVQKHDQSTGRLTPGIVADILTNAADHPRGIKVRLQDGSVGRIQQQHGGSVEQQQQQQHRHGGSDNFTASEDFNDVAAPRNTSSLADYFMPVVPPQPQQPVLVVAPSPFRTTAQDASCESWSCPACTFLNSSLLMECELCQTSKGGGD